MKGELIDPQWLAFVLPIADLFNQIPLDVKSCIKIRFQIMWKHCGKLQSQSHSFFQVQGKKGEESADHQILKHTSI